MLKRFIAFINKPTRTSEVLRFLIVGGLATVADFFVMGSVMYIFDPAIYPHFYNAFFGGTAEPAIAAKLLGTGVGFTVGLIANYVLSILFVFNEKGRSKTPSGFIKFAVFSVIGLFIHLLGMYLLSDRLSVNEWISKIILTIIVLVYNYVSRKLFIFRKEKDRR